MKKPIRVFYSELTERFYATAHYKEHKNGGVIITGEKFDVTDDICYAMETYKIEITKVTVDAEDLKVEVI